MISYLSNKQYSATTQMVEIACLSMDSKPTAGIANGSLCLEMDTGDIYAFNEAGEAWVKLTSGGGGGGGTASVTITNYLETEISDLGYADSLDDAKQGLIREIEVIGVNLSASVQIPIGGVIVRMVGDFSDTELTGDLELKTEQGNPYIEVSGDGGITFYKSI